MFKTNKKYLGIFKNEKIKIKKEDFYINKLNFALLTIFLITGLNNNFYKNEKNFKLKDNISTLNFNEINFEENGTFKIGFLSDLNLEKNNYNYFYNLNLSMQINKPNLIIFNGNMISKNCKYLSLNILPNLFIIYIVLSFSILFSSFSKSFKIVLTFSATYKCKNKTIFVIKIIFC